MVGGGRRCPAMRTSANEMIIEEETQSIGTTNKKEETSPFINGDVPPELTYINEESCEESPGQKMKRSRIFIQTKPQTTPQSKNRLLSQLPVFGTKS